MTVTVQGRTVAYIDTDPKNQDNRPTVLFLHGWGAPAETYRLLIDHLSTYCRVVAPDLPGFGGSATTKRRSRRFVPHVTFSVFVPGFTGTIARKAPSTLMKMVK